MSNTELVTKPKELSKATLSLFNSIVKKSDDENAHKSNNQLFPQLSFINDKKIFYKVRDENRQPKINLKNLEWLIDTTRNTDEIESSHLNFMDNYALIFQKDVSKSLDNEDYLKSKTTNVFDRLYNLSKADKNTAKLAQKPDTMDESKFVNEKSQKIMQKIEQEKNRISSYEQERQERSKSIKKLRNLVKKYPFERSDEENNQIFQILCGFEEFFNLLPTNLRTDKKFLLEFASCAQFESVNLKLSQVFGHFGFHMVLKGSVRPLSIPHLYRYQMKLNSGSTPEPPDDEHETLNIGECFGTIVDLSGREITTKMFRVLTLEEKCEFLKLSTESYKKVSQRILEEEKLNKLNLFKSCPGYAPWPKHSLEELINFFEWRTFAPNTILTNEGFLSPFIGFIDEGECHVLRKVDVTIINKKTKASEKRVRQVVVGKLSKHESFGEISVLMKEPMTCTIVTESRCHIGIIPFEKATKLDNLTQRLFMQTATRTFATLTQKEIYRMYIDAEKKKMWKEYKNLVIDDTIEKYNITPGHGKYEMPKIETRFNKT